MIYFIKYSYLNNILLDTKLCGQSRSCIILKSGNADFFMKYKVPTFTCGTRAAAAQSPTFPLHLTQKLHSKCLKSHQIAPQIANDPHNRQNDQFITQTAPRVASEPYTGQHLTETKINDSSINSCLQCSTI